MRMNIDGILLQIDENEETKKMKKKENTRKTNLFNLSQNYNGFHANSTCNCF